MILPANSTPRGALPMPWLFALATAPFRILVSLVSRSPRITLEDS